MDKLNLVCNKPQAVMTIMMSTPALIGLIVCVVILLLAAWITFVECSKIRFCKGKFYRVTFTYDGAHRECFISGVRMITPGKGGFRINRVKDLFVPFARQTCRVTVNMKAVKFIATKPLTNKLFCRTYPCSVASNKENIRLGRLESSAAIRAIFFEDETVEFNPELLEGDEHPNRDVPIHDKFFVTDDGKTILVYLTAKQERDLRKERW